MAINLIWRLEQFSLQQLHTVWLWKWQWARLRCLYNKILEKWKLEWEKQGGLLVFHLLLAYQRAACEGVPWTHMRDNDGRSETCIAHGHSHTQRQRAALLPVVCAKRNIIQQQSLDAEVFQSAQVHGDSYLLKHVHHGISVTGMHLQWNLTFLSCSMFLCNLIY